MKRMGFVKTRWFMFAAGILLASLVILGIRFATYSIPHTHYHANFALYINGQRDEINDVIHVHDDAVTWGQFFDNIGWALGPNFIQDDKHTLYVEDGANKLNIMLNDQNLTDLTAINNQTIKDEDRLLISFGDIDDGTLAKENKTVPATAHHYDITPDPASCAGQMDNPSASERLKHLF
jgi:hypothetical protein